MDSLHYCRVCGKNDQETTFRRNGSGLFRPDCLECEREKRQQGVSPAKADLVPVRQFSDVPVVDGGVVRGAQFEVDGPLYICITDVCEYFGIDTQTQVYRLRKDANYAPAMERGKDILTPGGLQRVWFIRGDKLAGWLHQINPNKVKAERTQALYDYRERCDQVLSDYMTGTRTAPPSPAAQRTPADLAPADVIYHERTYQKLEDIHNDLRGATLYRDRILIIRGSVYFVRLWPEDLPLEMVSQLIDIPHAVEMWRRGYRLYSIGLTGKKQTKDRLDTYAKKARMKAPPLVGELHVDAPEDAEKVLKKRRPRDVIPAEGCSEQFWCKPSIEDRIRRSWAKTPNISVADLELRMQGWEIGAPVEIVQEGLL